MQPEAAAPRGAWRGRLPPALRRRDYALLWAAILVTGFGGQMVVVAVGWQVYEIHHDPFDLGLIGLMEFVPLALLALPAGHLADRVPRRLILAASLVLEVAVAALLLVVSLSGADELWPFLVLAAAAGAAAAIGMPAGRALPATLVPLELVANAIALRSVAFQFAIIAGPALGGLLFAIDAEIVYGTAVVLLAIGFACVLAVREPDREPVADAPTVSSVLAGIGFIRRTPIVLGSITLDLFAMLLGGAIALAPVFAQEVLHTGPFGLGLLRSAPAVGALAGALMLARRPLRTNAGTTLLVVVALFGASMVVFGLSESLPLSLAALAFGGFVDMISMNIRSTTVAMVTPDGLRGRVLAVEMVFISASNELGAFESGAAAAILGTVPAVVAGGIVTIGLAAVWPRLFPALVQVGRLEDLRPARV